MLLLQEYNTVLNYQSACVDKTRKQIDYYFNNRLGNTFSRVSSVKRKLSRLSSFFTEQLLSSKGLVVVIGEKMEKLKGRDLSETITDTNKLISVYISLKDTLDTIVSDGVHEHFTELIVQQSVLADIIDNLYDVLKMLKRQNIKKNIETSQFAIDSSKHSVNSLETVLYGRSST